MRQRYPGSRTDLSRARRPRSSTPNGGNVGSFPPPSTTGSLPRGGERRSKERSAGSDPVVPDSSWWGVNMTGQSLAEGINARPTTLANTQPVGLGATPLMVDRYDTDAVKNANRLYTFEPPEIALAFTLAYLNQDRQIIVTNSGQSGAGFSGINQGTNPYNLGIGRLGVMNTEAVNASESLRAFLALIHGETDQIAPISNYDTLMRDYVSDWNTDAIVVVGASFAVPMFACQVSTLNNYATQIATVALAQLAASEADPLIHLVGPKYQYTYADALHIDGASSTQHGAQYGKVISQVANGQPWTPLSPDTIVASGSDIIVTLNVPVTPIVIDTTLIPAQTNFGFQINDSGGAAITGVTVTGANQLTVALDQAPASGARLRYVYSAASLAAFRGNIRDSDTTDLGPHTSATDAYNWLVHFDKPITGI